MTKGPRMRKRFRNLPSIRKRRIAQGFTIDAAAREAEISPNTIKKVENGHVSPRLETLSKLCIVYDCDLSELVADEIRAINRTRDAYHGRIQ